MRVHRPTRVSRLNLLAVMPRLVGLVAAVLAAAALAPAALAATGFASVQPTARVEHWQLREAAIAAQLADTARLRAVRLVFVGDSITDFWLFDDNPWVAGQRYGRTLWDESFSGQPPENLALNLGISGDRIEHVLHRLLPRASGGLGELDAPELRPEFFVLMLGINNTWAAEQPVVDSVVAGVREVMRTLQQRKPGVRIILQSLLPTLDEAKNAAVVRPVNQRLMALASQPPFAGQVSYLDLYPAFVDGSGRQIGTLFTDGLHPNLEGYRVWRSRLLPFLQGVRRGSGEGPQAPSR